ncbi:MAG: PilX N-terminal domain-containing pilus assembly protein, partial [Acidobacteriota bacterium]
MSTLLLTALGLGLVMTTITETMITSNYRDGGEALYAADAGVERVMQDLLTIPDWNRVLAGAVQSAVVDGTPGGKRTLRDGSAIDLSAATNTLNCGKVTTCSAAEMNAWSADRPWGSNNPRWQLFAYAPLENIIETATVASPMYVAVWVADDAAETDNDPLTDGGQANGRGILMLRAEAYGPGGSSSIIEATLGRTDTTELERGYTGQRGQDEQNRRARKAAVQSPGKALTRSAMDATAGGLV